MNKDKERIKELKKQIELHDRTIWELGKQAELREKEFETEEKKIRLEKDEENMKLEKENAQLKARYEELQKRLDDAPYKQLQDILKALVVKLPTIDIKGLSVHGKEK